MCEVGQFPWRLLDGGGEEIDKGDDARILCAGLRKLLLEATSVEALTAIWSQNESTLADLRRTQPDLTNARGTHFAEMLESIWERRRQELRPEDNPSDPPAVGDYVTERISRKRDPRHLQFVATRPCLICGRTPSQAHHLKTAQPRALGRKSGDDWTVPLCALHHRALHHEGNEPRWWAAQGIDPYPEARRLWELTSSAPNPAHSGGEGLPNASAATLLPINLKPQEPSEI
jgi:hypothetical protein